jgi:hypothetical protein
MHLGVKCVHIFHEQNQEELMCMRKAKRVLTHLKEYFKGEMDQIV